MSRVCLNPADEKVISLVENSKSNFTNFSDSQIRAVASLYFEKNNELPTPEQLLEFYASLQIQTPQEVFNQTEVTDKEDVLDLLQAVFFKGLARSSKGKPLTLSLIKEHQAKVLQKLPQFLEVNGLYSILENYSQYEQLLIKSRLKTLRIDFEENIESKEFQESKDEGWDKDSTLLSAYQTSTDEVIYLFAGLTSNEMIKGVNKPYNFKEAWDKTQILLAGTSDLQTQINLLRLSDLPFKEQLLNGLGYPNFDELSEADYSAVRTSFFQAFSKSAVNFSKSIPGKQTIDSGEEALMQNIQQEWKSKFLASEYSAIVNNKRVTNPEKIEELRGLSGREFLAKYGIEFTEWDNTLNGLANDVKKYFFNAIVEKQNNVSWLDEEILAEGSNKLLGTKSSLKDLLRYEASLRKKDTPLGARNADGEYQHGIMLHSYLSRKIGQLKHKLVQPKNEFEDLFYKGRAVINLDQGVKGVENSKSFNQLSEGDIYTSMISDMFSSQPAVHLPRPSDKKSEFSIKLLYSRKLAQTRTIKEYHNQHMAYTEIGNHLYKRLYKQYKNDYLKKSLSDINWTAKGNKAPIEFWNELLNVNQIPALTEEQFKEGINNYIESQLEDLYNDLVKFNVIVEDKGKLKTTFSDSFISPDFKNSKNQKEEINNLLRNYIFNSLLYGTEITQFTMGSLTTVNPEEFFKRTAGPIAQGRTPRTDSSIVRMLEAERPTYMKEFPSPDLLKVTISKEEEIPSAQAKEYNKAIGQEGAYDKVNVDDAQGKMIFEIYREYKKMLNEWTDEQEAGYRLLLQNRLDNEKYSTLYPPIKPVGYSLVPIENKKTGVVVDTPIYLKTAIYPIHKNLVKGTLNENLYDSMIGKGVAIHLPKSGIKLAYPKNLKEQFDRDGNAIINDDATFLFPTINFSSQLDIAIKEGLKILQGTQERKLIVSNLYKDGQLQNEEFANWVKDNTETLQQISDLEFEKLEEKAGIEMIDGLPTITDYSKLKTMLKDELLNRNLPLNSIEAINEIISEEGQLLSTIDAYPSRQKLMNLLNSIVTNKLIKLYTNGQPLVQIAQTGWELKPGSTVESETSITFINDEAKKNYIKNKGLQFLQLDEKTGAAEILLPAKFKKFVNLDGELDERTLISIGYRIPTQGLNSILHLKVVGFLPVGMDQMVVMPREITTQGGSDFDVDKLNLFVPNTFEGKYIDDSMDPEEVWKRIEELKTTGDEASNKLIEAIFGNLDELEETDENVLKEKAKFIRDFKLKRLQNKLIEQALEILQHKQSVKSLLTPNSSADLEALNKKINGDKKKMPIIDMFKPKTLASITRQMFASKALVGVFASQITHHVLAQQVGLHFKTGRRFYFNNDNRSLAGITNYKGELITDRIGNQYVTGSVDAAKNPFLFELGCTLDTGGVFALFERLGGNVEILVELIKQPIVQDYLLAIQNNNMLSAIKKQSKSILLAKIFEKYGYSKSGSEYLTDKYNNTEAKEVILDRLQQDRNEFGNWENNLTKLKSARQNNLEASLFNKVQKFALDDFLYLQDAASIVSESIATSKFDTSGPGKDIIQSDLLNENYKAFVKKMNGTDGYTLGTEKGDYDALIKDTLLDVFYKKSSSFVIDLYRDLVLLNKNETVKGLMHEFNNPDGIFVSKKLDEDGATLLYGSIINYVLQKSMDYNSTLFYGNNTVARKVLNIQKDENHPLHNNYVIKNIFNPEIGNGNNIPDIISITNKSIDQKESDYINQSFAQIKELDNGLYNDLITLSFYQTGMVASPVNYYQLLPYNDSLTLANNLLKKYDLVIPDMYTLAKEIMENIGTKLPNIQKVSYKEGDNNFGKVLQLKAARTKGKEYIVYYKNNVSALYKLKDNNNYVMVESKNYKSLFYNYSTNANYIISNEEEVILPETVVDEQEVKTVQPQIVQKDAWSELSLQQMTKLGKMGYTKELFNSLSIEEQQVALNCHGNNK